MASVLTLSILMESLLSLPAVLTDTHTLHHYFTTIWSQNWSTPPQTEVVVSLDDAPILKYSSSNYKLQLLHNWLENIYLGHWELLEQKAKYYVQRHQHTIRRLPSMGKQNDTDLIVFQVKFSCYLYEDDSTGGEEEFAVNGRDFIFLDNEKRIFMASETEGKALALEWNKRHNSAKRQFYYKDVACVQWMRDYLSIKNEQKVRPKVEVRGRISNKMTRLHCLVYGFRPKDVIVKWVRNGVDDVPSDEMSPILPHPDGTYQIRVSAEVPTREGDTYACHVDHSSLEEPLIVNLGADQIYDTDREKMIVRQCIILSALIFVGLLVIVVVVYLRISGADQIYDTHKEKITARDWIISLALISISLLVIVVVVYLRISGRKNKAFTEPD